MTITAGSLTATALVFWRLEEAAASDCKDSSLGRFSGARSNGGTLPAAFATSASQQWNWILGSWSWSSLSVWIGEQVAGKDKASIFPKMIGLLIILENNSILFHLLLF